MITEIEQLSTSDKLKLIRVLTDDLDKARDISPLVPHKTYHVYTPFDCADVGAGTSLMAALRGREQESH